MRKSALVIIVFGAWATCAAQAIPHDVQDVPPASKSAFKPLRPGGSEETLTRFIRMRNRVRNLDLRMHRENGGMVLEGFTGKLGGGEISVDGRVDWSRPEARHRARLTVQNVGTREFLDAFDIVLDGRISTVITGFADLQWNGTKMKAMKRSLDATAELNIGPGYVSNAKVLEYIASVSGIEALRKIEFSRGIMRGHSSNQTLFIDELWLEGPALRARLTGTMDLLTDEIRLRPELAISPELAQSSVRNEVRAGMQVLDTLTKDRASRLVSVPLPIVFGGTLKKPILMMDAAPQEKPGQ